MNDENNNEVENEVEKQVFSNYRKTASIVLTVMTIIVFFWKYLAFIPLGAIMISGGLIVGVVPLITNLFYWSILITLIADIRALYLYIKYILESFANKKRVRSIILAIILIAVIILFRTQENFMNDTFISLTYSILLVTCMTIIPVVRAILDLINIWKKYKKEKKDKKKSIIKTIAIILIICATQVLMVFYSYFITVITVSELRYHEISEIFALKEKKQKVVHEDNTISNPHISSPQRNMDIVFDSKKLREDWITSTDKYNPAIKGTTVYSFENDINLNSDKKDLEYMKVCFQLKDDLTNFVPIEDKEENYSMIDSYLIASSKMEIRLKPGVELKNKYYTLRLNRYDKDFNVQTHCKYIFEPVAEVGTDYKGRQVIFINYDNVYALGTLENIEIIL